MFHQKKPKKAQISNWLVFHRLGVPSDGQKGTQLNPNYIAKNNVAIHLILPFMPKSDYHYCFEFLFDMLLINSYHDKTEENLRIQCIAMLSFQIKQCWWTYIFPSNYPYYFRKRFVIFVNFDQNQNTRSTKKK